jgi:hypothetical protein
MTSEIQPSAKESIGHTDNFRFRLSILIVPIVKRTAVSTKGIKTKGGHVQLVNNASRVSVNDQAGVAEKTAAAPTAAIWVLLTDIFIHTD